MTDTSFIITPELPVYFDRIDAITRQIFGPGMFARAAYRLREGVLPEAHLSFVAMRDNKIVGSVRQTRILIGDTPALLLGPLGVLPEFKNSGIGKKLMQASVLAAQSASVDGDAAVIVLVGDLAYYAPFGFKQVSPDRILMPRPVDIGRVLACELVDGALAKTTGEARNWV